MTCSSFNLTLMQTLCMQIHVCEHSRAEAKLWLILHFKSTQKLMHFFCQRMQKQLAACQILSRIHNIRFFFQNKIACHVQIVTKSLTPTLTMGKLHFVPINARIFAEFLRTSTVSGLYFMHKMLSLPGLMPKTSVLKASM